MEEFNMNDRVEVSNDNGEWLPGIFLCMDITEHDYQYVVKCDGDDTFGIFLYCRRMESEAREE